MMLLFLEHPYYTGSLKKSDRQKLGPDRTTDWFRAVLCCVATCRLVVKWARASYILVVFLGPGTGTVKTSLNGSSFWRLPVVHIWKYGDIGSRQIKYKRLLWYEFKNTASSYGDLRDNEGLSEVTLVCKEKKTTPHPSISLRVHWDPGRLYLLQIWSTKTCQEMKMETRLPRKIWLW